MDPVERALQELALACRRAAEALGVDSGEPLPMEELTIPITIPLGRDSLRAAAEAEGLTARIAERVEEATKAHLAFRIGRIYCFQCDSTDCAHASPPSPRTPSRDTPLPGSRSGRAS